MPIKPTADGGYDVSVCVHYRRLHRRLPPGTSASDAKHLEAQLRIALRAQPGQRRSTSVPGDPPLSAVMALYAQAAQHLRSPDTATYHAARIAKWCELYPASQARQCAAHIVADMTGHYKPATINRSLGCLKRGLRLAWERGATAADHSAAVQRLPENNAKTLYLSMAQVKQLADAASPAVRAAIWIGLLTGCRRGEVLLIKREDIGRDTLTIQAGNTKTLRYRQVPILPALRPWLTYLPLAINKEGLKSGLRRAIVKAGLPGVTYHTLRHSCATLLLAPPINAALHVVRDILGHTTIKTTERYAHAMIQPQRDALAKLGALHQTLHQRPKRPRKAHVSR